MLIQPDQTQQDLTCMRQALAQAQRAAQMGEVPVGAVVVQGGQCIASSHNQPIALHDPTAHAEVLALRAAAQQLGNYRLDDATLYVTLEPCFMCWGAMVHARIGRVVFGAHDTRQRACPQHQTATHWAQQAFAAEGLMPQVQSGVLADECAQLLQQFFKPKRSHASRLRPDALRPPETARLQLVLPPRVHHCYTQTLPFAPDFRLHHLHAKGLELDGDPAAAQHVVLLHGLNGWSAQYLHQLAQWQLQYHHVWVPDAPGFGLSDGWKKPKHYTPQTWPQAIFEWATQLQLPASHWVVPQSMAWLMDALQALGAPVQTIDWLPDEAMTYPPQWPDWQHTPYPNAGHWAAHTYYASQTTSLPTATSTSN
jgi:tRNA(adenine34) deaminase